MASYVRALEGKASQETQNQRRPHGGRWGNRNAWKTGLFTAEALAARKAAHAKMKALAILIAASGLSAHRIRPNALRADQWELIAASAPELADLLAPHLPLGFFAVDSAACPYVLGK